jgi:hypothetical protein
MKKRKFDSGGEINDAEEAKYKALGLAASNAEKKSSGFFSRFAEGNIDEKGSEAYNKYGAGYGRRLEAEKAAKAPQVNTAPQSQPVAPVVKTAPVSRPVMPSNKDTSYDSLESKRLASPRSTVSPGVTRVTEDMPTSRPTGGAQVTTGDARVAEYADAYPSSTTPEKADKGARDTSSYKKATSKGSGTAAAPKAAIRTKNNDQAEDQKSYDSLESKRLASPRGGASRGGQGGPTREQLENYARKGFAANPMSTDPSQRRSKTASAPAKATASAPVQTKEPTVEDYKDNPKLSLAERNELRKKRNALTANKGTPTDYRNANERIKSMFGLKKGGGVKGYASGGSVSSRADGIAQRGKTRCKVC